MRRVPALRARNIKPSLFKNELLGVADPLLTIVFEGLWCEADREGRLEDRPLRLRAEILPYRYDADMEKFLAWLATNGFIHRYEAEGTKVIQIIKFHDHQRPHVNEVASVLPSMDDIKHNQGGKSAQPRRQALRSDSPSLIPDPGSLIPDPTAAAPRARSAAKPAEPDPEGLDLEAAARFIEYRRTRKPAIRAESMGAFKRKLAAYGAEQMAVVENSIANGYQGLVEPKTMGGHAKPAAPALTWRPDPADDDPDEVARVRASHAVQ